MLENLTLVLQASPSPLENASSSPGNDSTLLYVIVSMNNSLLRLLKIIIPPFIHHIFSYPQRKGPLAIVMSGERGRIRIGSLVLKRYRIF